MIDMDNLEWATAVPGSIVLEFPIPGLLAVRGPRSLPGFRLMRTGASSDALVEGTSGKRGEVAFSALLLVGAIHGGSGSLSWRLKKLGNEGLHQVAWCLGGFGGPIALGRLAREQADIPTAQRFLCLSKACHPTVQGTRGSLRMGLFLPLQVGNDLRVSFVGLAQIGRAGFR